MPSIRSKLAPYFSGKISQPIEEFLEEYDELADKHGLTDRQKVETVIRYVNEQQRHIWRSLDGFLNRDWDQFRAELRDEYVSPTAAGKHTKKMLIELAEDSAQSRMEYETDVIDYHRQFNTISKPLIDNGKITISERNILFWHGFHPEDRRALHERLIAKQPDNPRGQAFDLKDVFKTARAIFSGDDDFLLQEPPPRRRNSDRARDRRTERNTRQNRESERDERASRRGRTREPPSFERQESGDEQAPSSDEEEESRRGH